MENEPELNQNDVGVVNPNEVQLSSQGNQPAPSNLPNGNEQSKKFGKKAILLIVLALLVVGSGAALAYVHFHKTPKTATTNNKSANTAAVQTTKTAPSTLLTYVNQNKSKDLIVTDSQQKVLATLSLPSGKNTFTVLANNGKAVLVEEAFITGGPDANSVYYLVSNGGQSTQLPANTASVLHKVVIGGAFLGNNNDYLYVSCDKTSCMLNDLNLTSGVSSVEYSTPFTQSQYGTGSATSLSLIGVSPDNLAYLINYGSDGQGAGTLKEINIATKQTVKSYSMSDASLNTPNLAPDYRHLIYTQQADNVTIEVMDLSSGKTTPISTSATKSGASYVWSPDSSKAAFSLNVGPASDQPVGVAYVDIASQKIVDLKNFGVPKFNNVDIEGWSSNASLNYTYTQTATANDFSTSLLQDFAIDTASGKVTSNPAPTGYRLVVASSF